LGWYYRGTLITHKTLHITQRFSPEKFCSKPGPCGQTHLNG